MGKPEEVDEELEWLRSITGKQTIKVEDLKTGASQPLPRPPGPHFRQAEGRFESTSRYED